MVLIKDGNSEHVAQAWRDIGLFGEKNPIQITEFLIMCEPHYE